MTATLRRHHPNRMALWLLHSPAHGLLDEHICEVEYVGRVTGTVYRLPVEVVRDRGRLLVLVAHAARKRWWRNFRGVGHQLNLTVRGTVHRAYAVTLAPGDPGYADALVGYVAHRRTPRDDDHRLVVIRLTS
jgi:hypothetical protein